LSKDVKAFSNRRCIVEIAYFTHAEDGNTEILTRKIAGQLNLPTNRIMPKKTYPISYEALVERAKDEHEHSIFPEASINHEISDDVLILGTPIWFCELPNVVKRFLKEQLVAPRVIYPFCTNEGSGLGNSINELKAIFPDTEIKPGLAVQGSKVNKADQAVANWLEQLNLI